MAYPERHSYPLGESFIQHGGADCVCEPVRTVVTKGSSSGRGGSHQGYAVLHISYKHNPLPSADN